ncbi:MAG: helix-turn-helix domain-containing protein [Duncaniella sp.]|nr:helix-turn-helix domain-containing protein [Duncaniella sp.]
MNRIDLTRLRKRAGMSQRDLAERLQVQPSFLSAIENGRSRMPDEKMETLKEIFELDNFDDYLLPDEAEREVPPHTHPADQNDLFSQLLNHFHEEAHRRSPVENSRDLLSRIEYLTRRNDRLSERIDNLREEIDSLRSENFRLKETLLKNGLTY